MDKKFQNKSNIYKKLVKTRQSNFDPRNALDLFIVYELEARSRDLNTVFTVKGCLFGAVNLTKNADPDKNSYSGYGIGFVSRSNFLILISWCKNVTIFGIKNSSSVHNDNNKKYLSPW